MDEKSDASTRDISRSDTGTPTGPLASPAPTQQMNQADVPPELRSSSASYSTSGEPTRQWSGSSQPPPQHPPPPSGSHSAPQPPQPPYPKDGDWRDRRYNRTPILWPFLLIAAGVIFLLNNLDVLPWSVWGQLWKLWPLILILIGLEILLGRRSPGLAFLLILVVIAAGIGFIYANGGLSNPGELTQSSLNVPLSGASKADVRIEMDAGQLILDGDNVGSGQLATGELDFFQNQDSPNQLVSVNDGTAQLTLSQGDGNGNFWPFGLHNRTFTWDIHLNPEIPMNLRVETGAGNGDLDLEKLKITDLTLNRGAGNITVTMPSSGSATGAIHGGVGNLELIVPEGVVARLKVNTGIGKVNVDDSFTKQGDTYSLNYSSEAKNKVDLTLDAGIGNVNVRTK